MAWRSRLLAGLSCLAGACGGGSGGGSAPPPATNVSPPVPSLAEADHVRFSNVARTAGIDYIHRFTTGSTSTEAVAGVAVGDVDGDGWLDLYIAQGDTGQNLLYRFDGTSGLYSYTDVAEAAGVAMETADKSAGPALADYDGDGDLDLIVGGVEYSPPRLFRNDGNGSFTDVTPGSGLDTLVRENTVSAAFADYDGDDDLDLFLAHWTFTLNELPAASPQFLWRNNGDGTFSDVSNETLMTDAAIDFGVDYSFTPTFADVDDDGDADLLLVSDNNTSQIIVNNGDQGGGLVTFSRITDEGEITDQAGMGSAVADFDNDGDLDWFVSSINEDGNRDRNGNRFYRNTGNGTFVNETTETGLRDGDWGWASCAADFNNDGYLDLFHVNGIGEAAGTSEFVFDRSRLFIANADGTFTERSAELGIDDTRQGRGIVCYDGDQDGDIDIFVANNGQIPALFQNDGGNTLNWLNVRLSGNSPNTAAAGARIYVSANGMTQMREVAIGNNYVSQNPLEQHFGLNRALQADSVRIVWPDGTTTERTGVGAEQRLTVSYPDTWSSD